MTQTDYLSVGGTLSVGGMDGGSYRYGVQVDNALELQVVTGEGRVETCSASHLPELFESIYAGLGQCGIILRATLRMIPADTHTLFIQMLYRDLPGLAVAVVVDQEVVWSKGFGFADRDKRTPVTSLVYDLGLVKIDESILTKKKLIDTEIQSLRSHPHSAVELLHTIEFAEDVNNAILHHHERYDGTGYPSGLKGAEIPLISRVISVVDSYRAMISERPYNRQITREEALLNIKKGSGTIYDPEVVKAFESVFRADLS